MRCLDVRDKGHFQAGVVYMYLGQEGLACLDVSDQPHTRRNSRQAKAHLVSVLSEKSPKSIGGRDEEAG